MYNLSCWTFYLFITVFRRHFAVKRFFVLSFFAIFSTSICAQNWASSEGSCFQKGDINVSAGLGIGWFGFFAVGEYGINDAISVSVGTGYNGYGFSDYLRYNYIPIVARGAFHPFNLKVLSNKIKIRNKLDPYAGLALGYHIGWASDLKDNPYDDATPSVGHFSFREYIGAKYYPTEKFYLTLEEGGGLSWLNFGVGLKF